MRFAIVAARALALLAVAALGVGVACNTGSSGGAASNEGDACDVDDGDRDCDDGMVCERPPNPDATNAPDVCCPPPGGTTTAAACTAPDAGNPAPPDGSMFPG